MPAASAPRAQRMFLILAGFFVANAIIAEFIGVKIFALEDTLGLNPFEWRL
ncbi:MAG: VUT family protein, partial [Dokdonella sp.]